MLMYQVMFVTNYLEDKNKNVRVVLFIYIYIEKVVPYANVITLNKLTCGIVHNNKIRTKSCPSQMLKKLTVL